MTHLKKDVIPGCYLAAHGHGTHEGPPAEVKSRIDARRTCDQALASAARLERSKRSRVLKTIIMALEGRCDPWLPTAAPQGPAAEVISRWTRGDARGKNALKQTAETRTKKS